VTPRAATFDGTTAKAIAKRAAFRVPLLIALVASAAAALLGQPRIVASVRAGALDAAWLVVAPAAFALVVVLSALEAWRTARVQGYFPGRSVLAVAAAAAFLGVLVPDTYAEYRTRRSAVLETPPQHWQELVRSHDARVRALVMEAAGYAPVSDAEAGPVLARGLDDPDPLVVRAALQGVRHRADVPLETLEEARTAVHSWGM
jgi:hypothetical protein